VTTKGDGEVVEFTVGKGDKVDYKVRPDYCLKDCFSTSHAFSHLVGHGCNKAKGGHIRVATQWSSQGNFAKLCCVPMRAPAIESKTEEKTFEVKSFEEPLEENFEEEED